MPVQVGAAIDSQVVMAMQHTDTEAAAGAAGAAEDHEDGNLLVDEGEAVVVREVREMGELAVDDVCLELVAMTCLSEDDLEVHLNG